MIETVSILKNRIGEIYRNERGYLSVNYISLAITGEYYECQSVLSLLRSY